MYCSSLTRIPVPQIVCKIRKGRQEGMFPLDTPKRTQWAHCAGLQLVTTHMRGCGYAREATVQPIVTHRI